MIYTSQFLIKTEEKEKSNYDRMLQYSKEQAKAELGVLIGEKVDFEKIEKEDGDQYELKIVGFPLKKWLSFTGNLKRYGNILTREDIERLLIELQTDNKELENKQQ